MQAKSLLLFCGLAAASLLGSVNSADAGYRQYYSGYTYHQPHNYHYSTYYYKPTPSYPSYNYHYCVHYPSQPRYVYYYNPVSRHYWGRFDLEGKDGAHYSILAEKDRKENLKEIPESAFPAPAAMPEVPDCTDGEKIELPPAPPSSKDLPK